MTQMVVNIAAVSRLWNRDRSALKDERSPFFISEIQCVRWAIATLSLLVKR